MKMWSIRMSYFFIFPKLISLFDFISNLKIINCVKVYVTINSQVSITIIYYNHIP